jgi:membrane-associated protein
MEPGLFRKNTVIGAIAWVPLFLLTGFFVGEIMWVKNNYGLIFLCLIVITLIPFLVTLIKMTLKR